LTVGLLVAACADTTIGNLTTVLGPLLDPAPEETGAPEDTTQRDATPTPEAPTGPAVAAALVPDPPGPPAAATPVRGIDGIYPDVQRIRPPDESQIDTALLLPPLEAPALTPPEDEEPPPIHVAILLPLSGSSSKIGAAMLNAAQMALFDVAGDRLVLHPKDTQGTPDGAVVAMEAALQDGAELILGPLFANSVRAAAGLSRERGINVVAFSNDRSVAGRGVYLMGFMREQEIARVVAYARTQGIARFAALVPESPYGEAVEMALLRAAQRAGGAVVRVERYPAGATDFFEPVQRLASYEARRAELQATRRELEARGDEIAVRTLRRLKGLDTIGDLGYDAVVIAEGGTRLQAIAPLLPFFDIDPDDVRFLGTGLWNEPGVGREPALVGAWFAGPSPGVGEGFRTRYQALYGSPPPRIASLAYDATALAAILARGRERPEFSAASLTVKSGFSGVDGIFRFDAGGVAVRGLAVLEIRPRTFRVLSNAPKSFEELVN
jgi:ABC-type branched-subunit amino acid transport system substrate-binding protein